MCVCVCPPVMIHWSWRGRWFMGPPVVMYGHLSSKFVSQKAHWRNNNNKIVPETNHMICWIVKQEMSRNPNLMTFSLWLLTILAVSIAMIFGLLGAIFSIINTVMTPIETITGVQGLYLWNGLACKYSAVVVVAVVKWWWLLNCNVLWIFSSQACSAPLPVLGGWSSIKLAWAEMFSPRMNRRMDGLRRDGHN